MGSLENLGDVKKIQPMLFEIGKSFRLDHSNCMFQYNILCHKSKYLLMKVQFPVSKATTSKARKNS